MSKKIHELPAATESEAGDELNLTFVGSPITGQLKKYPRLKADWNAAAGPAQILNKPNVVAVELAATFAAIAGGTTMRFVYVAADETNNGDTSLYLHTGTALKFLLTVL